MADHPNVELIRRFYAAFASPGWSTAVREMLADGVVWHLPGAHPLSGEHRGREAVLAAMRSFDGSVQLKLHDVVGNDAHAVALLKARGERKGRTYEALEADVFHIRDGKIAEFWSLSEDQRKTDAYWA